MNTTVLTPEEIEYWERVKDIDFESLTGPFESEILHDYDWKMYLLSKMNQTKTQSTYDKIDAIVQAKGLIAPKNDGTKKYYDDLDEYFLNCVDSFGGKLNFSLAVRKMANEILEKGFLDHYTNGPKIPSILKAYRKKFDSWSHYYMPTDGFLTIDENHIVLDQFIAASMGIHPAAIQKGLLHDYGNCVQMGYDSGDVYFGFNFVPTILQQKKMIELIEEVINLGGTFYWASKRNEKYYSGNNMSGFLFFLDDLEKNKLKDVSQYDN